jgi:hypothetical protein
MSIISLAFHPSILKDFQIAQFLSLIASSLEVYLESTASRFILLFRPSRPSLSNLLLSHFVSPSYRPMKFFFRYHSYILAIRHDSSNEQDSFPYIGIRFMFVSISKTLDAIIRNQRLGYQAKSIVNKIIKLFYVFMLASIASLRFCFFISFDC